MNEEEKETYKRMCNDVLKSFKQELELKNQMEIMEWNIKKNKSFEKYYIFFD